METDQLRQDVNELPGGTAVSMDDDYDTDDETRLVISMDISVDSPSSIDKNNTESIDSGDSCGLTDSAVPASLTSPVPHSQDASISDHYDTKSEPVEVKGYFEPIILNTTKDRQVVNQNQSSIAVSNAFRWDDYLRECNGIVAPSDCFFQDENVPENKFEQWTKVEVPDPRGNEVTCLATIVSIHTYWICVRLDGEDASNDHWLICNDECIRPVGDCQRNGSTLQPPCGFTHSLANFHKFLDNQLKPDEHGESPCAKLESFTPISMTYHPRVNKFQVGMKCEAIDRKNFIGLPCPATVVSVNGNYLMISFDGWNQAYDTKERFDSRYIFPAGWADKCGLQVQPPKRVKGVVIQRVLEKKDDSKNSKQTTSRKGATKIKPKSSVKRRSTSKSNANRKRVQKKPDNNASGSNVAENCLEANNNISSDGVSKTSKNKALPSSSRTLMHDQTDQLIVARARKTSAPEPLLPQHKKLKLSTDLPSVNNLSDPASEIILSTSDEDWNPSSEMMTVYFNRNCRCTPLLDPALLFALPAQIGPSSVHHVLRETVQQIVNCALQPSEVFKRLKTSPLRIIIVTASINNTTFVRAIPTVKNLLEAWEYLASFICEIDVCPNIISDSSGPCAICTVSAEVGVVSTTADRQSVPRRTASESDDGSAAGCEVKDWSIEQVEARINEIFGSSLAQKFPFHQIDGEALMLLTVKVMIEHMDMPIGLAVKVRSFIDSLITPRTRTREE